MLPKLPNPPQLELKKSLLLLSGGLDSVVLFYLLYFSDIPFECLIMDYGQPGKKEIKCSKKLCKEFDIHYQIFYLDKKLFFRDNSRNYSPSLGCLPNRNGVFLSIAATYAIQRNISNIYIGVIGSTTESFCDCQPDFIQKYNDLLNVSDLSQVKIVTPLIRKSKLEVIELALDLNINLEDCWSCDTDGERPCGKCAGCKDILNSEKEIKQKLLKKIHKLNTTLLDYN